MCWGKGMGEELKTIRIAPVMTLLVDLPQGRHWVE